MVAIFDCQLHMAECNSIRTTRKEPAEQRFVRGTEAAINAVSIAVHRDDNWKILIVYEVQGAAVNSQAMIWQEPSQHS